ncbi:hypothetical protein SH661x_001976 [Planctomicrobium sp. SH661]|uniref:hypothetical protein n=1 Tax=Planctomicrobium sp. SH661 TaxID=3448124 RepID=UPI003F5BECB6
MSKRVAILALVQSALVILGYFCLGAVMKVIGYPQEIAFARWNPLAIFLRQYGMALLLLPVSWVLISPVVENRRLMYFGQDVWLIIGVAICMLMICLFLPAIISPFTRPMLYGN